MPAWLLAPLKWLFGLLFDYIKDIISVAVKKKQHIVVKKKELEPKVKAVVDAAEVIMEENRTAKLKGAQPNVKPEDIEKLHRAADDLNRTFF